MTDNTVARQNRHGLQVDSQLADFVETKALPGTGIAADEFWKGVLGHRARVGAEEQGAAR